MARSCVYSTTSSHLFLKKTNEIVVYIVSFSLVVGYIGSVSVLVPRRGWSLLPAKELCLGGGGYSDG